MAGLGGLPKAPLWNGIRSQLAKLKNNNNNHNHILRPNYGKMISPCYLIKA
jgi:hypothetical protein